MPNIRDDSAGNYGSWSNPEDQSWYDWLRMKAADVQEGGKNAQTNILSALSPYGDEGWQVPPALHEPINALMRLAENSRLPDGRLGIPNPDNAQNRDDVLTGLLSMYGGNAMNPRRLMKGAAAKAAPEAAREAPYAMYRGAPNADGLFPTDRPLFMSSSPEVAGKPMRAYRGYGGRSEDEAFLYPERDMLFASSDPHTAATYANSAPNGDPVLSRYGISTQGAVAPLEMNFENPLRVDAQGSVWDQIPFNGKSWSTTDEIANLARERGHDGLILDNVRDGIGTAGNYLPPASTYVALKRGTVTSPLTGETLFSDNLPSIWGNALAPYQDEPRNALLNY